MRCRCLLVKPKEKFIWRSFLAVLSDGRDHGRDGIWVWHEDRDEVLYLLDLVLAPGGDEISGDGLSSEERSRHPDFGLGRWPFPTVEGVHDEVGDVIVRRDILLEKLEKT